MVSEFEKILDFDSDTFEDMKRDMNFILQRLVGTMQDKGATEGSMTLKLDVTMVKEFIPNYDPDIQGETREVSKPQFKHKVTSAVKINDDKSGTFNNEMELVMDEDTGVFKLVPIANTQQRSILDSDFQEQNNERYRLFLPGPQETDAEGGEEDSELTQEGTEQHEYEGDSKGVGELGEELTDITEELLGGEDQLGNTGPDSDYGYDDPENEAEE